MGLILLLLLVLAAVCWSTVDEIKYNSRRESAMDKANSFATDLADAFNWPADMPNIDATEIERNPEKYLPYLDKGVAKVRPYIYNNKQIEKEIEAVGLEFIRTFLVIGEKPTNVTFKPNITKLIVRKETAVAKCTIATKSNISKGKTKDKPIVCEIDMEYVNNEWVVVNFFPLEEI